MKKIEKIKCHDYCPAWCNEPDLVDFVYRGYRCRIQRIFPLGHLAGYVVLPENHPWNNKSYHDIPADIHGGLTFAQYDTRGTFWVIGFDCAHSGDLIPGLVKSNQDAKKKKLIDLAKKYLTEKNLVTYIDNFILKKEVYRDIKFLRKQIRRLVKQAIEAHDAARNQD